MLLLAACVLASGCNGSAGEGLASVEGTVTLDGQPLPNAQVIFQPAAGRPSTAITDAEGKYQLQYTMDQAGAEVGSHAVKVTTAIDQPDDTRASEQVPKKYNLESELVEEVEPGKNTIDFELSK
ncbi:MAG: carboxypeptidase-like regulatory domain-containing protein [Pirellulaceae bacterium]